MQTRILGTISFHPYIHGASHEVERGGVVLTPQEVRQGVISGRVLLVLTTSLMLAVTAGVILATVHVFPI
jgi:hypothetical protein